MTASTSPTYTDDDILNAMKRIYAACGQLTQSDYMALRKDSEPSERTVRFRFGTFNRAKIRAGLPITVRAGNVRTEAEADEVEAPPPAPTSEYPCWRCHRGYQGRGRKQGDYFCHSCRGTVHEMASNMAWLG